MNDYKIYIPTVNRPDNQITYEALPDELKSNVTLVVQKWERDKYNYDCNYLVLPDEINLSDYLCLAKTRDFIHKNGRNGKYMTVDDDVLFKRRNAKYSTGISDMEKSQRNATHDDILEMFDLFWNWLDEPEVSFCGPAHLENPPANKPFTSNSALSNCVFYNGPDFSGVLDTLPTTVVRYSEDTLFILSLLSKGFGNRISQVFAIDNKASKSTTTVWDNSTYEDVWRDHRKIQEYFPEFYKVLLDKNGNRVTGGYRNYGKTKVSYAKAYKSSFQRRTRHV
jgi:hypothetical protein